MQTKRTLKLSPNSVSIPFNPETGECETERYHYQLIDRNNVLAECVAASLTEALPLLGDDLEVEYEFKFSSVVRNQRRGHVFLVQWHPAISQHAALLAAAELLAKITPLLPSVDSPLAGLKDDAEQALCTLNTIQN